MKKLPPLLPRHWRPFSASWIILCKLNNVVKVGHGFSNFTMNSKNPHWMSVTVGAKFYNHWPIICWKVTLIFCLIWFTLFALVNTATRHLVLFFLWNMFKVRIEWQSSTILRLTIVTNNQRLFVCPHFRIWTARPWGADKA